MSVLCAFGSACESSSAADEVDLRKVALATVRLYRSCRIDTFFCIALLERELEKAGYAFFYFGVFKLFLSFFFREQSFDFNESPFSVFFVNPIVREKSLLSVTI